MRYAILSDIHANRQALKAVLTDVRSIGVDRIITLGDLVGYGPNPAEVLEQVHSAVNFFVLGNHDAVVSGQLSSEYFNDRARKVIDWTRSVLDRKAVEFFTAMPLQLHGKNCRFAHGDFINSGQFEYIIEPDEALANFQATADPLLFVGHSHLPGIFVTGKSGRPHWLAAQDFVLEEEKRFIVNVGSVGQPRDDDVRASYCLYDESARDITFRKVPFDLDAYREDVRRAGIPAAASYFLAVDSGQRAPALRDLIDFRPVKASDSVKTADDIRSLTTVVRKYHRLRVLVWLLVALFLAGLATLAFLHQTGRLVRTEVIIEKQTEIIREAAPARHFIAAAAKSPPVRGLPQPEIELLAMPPPHPGVTLAQPLQFWEVACQDPVRQQVAVTIDPTDPQGSNFRLIAEVVDPFELSSLPVVVAKGMRFTAQAQFKRVDLQGGFIEIQLEHELSDGTRRVIGRTAPKNFAGKMAWTPVSFTLAKDQPLEANGRLRFRIHGEFKGEILIRKCSLKRRE